MAVSPAASELVVAASSVRLAAVTVNGRIAGRRLPTRRSIMGLLDKVKGALHAVTGGSTTVQFMFGPQILFPGEQVQIGISATSTGNQVQSKGVFIDLAGTELIDFTDANDNHIRHQERTFYREIQGAAPFVLAPGETKQFQITLLVPMELRPTFQGQLCRHQWQIRGRIEAFGNDPDTGWIDTRVGLKQ